MTPTCIAVVTAGAGTTSVGADATTLKVPSARMATTLSRVAAGEVGGAGDDRVGDGGRVDELMQASGAGIVRV